jgi:TetR/AcrR family transcriptional regulator, transcriptional repressor for nem operon
MGRASRHQAMENRARIVEVASGLFRTHGVDAVSISDVMKAAGMTQGGFYNHFESKEALAAEAWTSGFSAAVDAWKRVANKSARAGREGLVALVRYYFATKAAEQTCPMVALAPDAGACEHGHPMRLAYGAGVKRLFDAFAEVAQSSDAAPARDEMCMLFAAMIGANMLSRAMDKDPWIESLKKVVQTATETAGG